MAFILGALVAALGIWLLFAVLLGLLWLVLTWQFWAVLFCIGLVARLTGLAGPRARANR